MGVKVKWGKKTKQKILKLIADGYSLRQITEDDTLPNREIIRKWRINDEDFAGRYATAKGIQADNIFESIREMSLDLYQKALDSYIDITILPPSKELIMATTLAINTAKWYVAKLAPKLYGNHMNIMSQKDEEPVILVREYSKIENNNDK